MPIEIRELVIKATVAPGGERDQAQPAAMKLNDADRRRLVEESVAQVLDVLRRKQDR